MLEKYGVENPNYINGVSEKIQKTKKQKYGERLEKVVEKMKSTSYKRYGVENAGNTKEAREKAKQTSIRKYGTSNPAQSEIVKLHTRENNYKKYGKEHPMQVEEIKRKASESFRKRNSRQNFGTKEFKENFEKKFGVENPSQLESVKQKKIETTRKRFGVDNPFQSDIVKAKIKNKLVERYGVEHPLQNKSIFRKVRSKYVFENEYFDSSWELALWIYAKDHNEEIERLPCSFEYEFEGQIHKYFPDFRYKGELVEIKGDQFFNEKGEPVNPFGEVSWEAKYDCIRKNNVTLITGQDLNSIFSYIEETYGKNYLKSFKK